MRTRFSIALAAVAAISTASLPEAWAARPTEGAAVAGTIAGTAAPEAAGAERIQLVRLPHIPRGGGRGGSGQSSQQRQYQKYLQRQQQAYIQQQQAEAAKAANAPPPEPTTGARGRQAHYQSLLKRFDANGDGKLSDAERRTAKSTLAKEKAAGEADPAGAPADPATANGGVAAPAAGPQGAIPAGAKRRRPK